jgi:predicted nucleotide-binding protein
MPHFPGSTTELKLPLEQAETELEGRIDIGRQLLNEEDLRPPATEPPELGMAARMLLRGAVRGLAMTGTGVNEALKELAERAGQWHNENCVWLDQNLGGEVAELQRSFPIRMPVNPVDWKPYLRKTIEEEISRLGTTKNRLQHWVPKTVADPAGPARKSGAVSGAPIFIVHGSDTLRAERVARTVNNATGRDTIILREQPNLGQTLLEKFEQHATSASYAVVVLTPDDEGGREGHGQHNLRARQNVIFEMGYFYGVLGRGRVSVLLYQGVEKPSDIDGIAYIDFDDSGAWKIELLRELEHAKIRVDMSQAF